MKGKVSPKFFGIGFRLLLFNSLLVFLPIAGSLYLGTYENQLLLRLERSMVQQGRILASALSNSPEELGPEARRILSNLNGRNEARLRIIDTEGLLVADSSTWETDEAALAAIEPVGGPSVAAAESTRVASSSASTWPDQPENAATPRMAPPEGSVIVESGAESDANDEESALRESFLYRLAMFPVNAMRAILSVVLGRPEQALGSADFYTTGENFLDGPEIQAAFQGQYGAATRISSGGQRSVNLYSAMPIFRNGEVAGVVLVNQSTYRILGDLYQVRLDLFQLFLISIVAAVVLSLLLSRSITRPIRQLARQSGSLVDHRGRLKTHFTAYRRRDEIGELSRALESLTVRIEKHREFTESFASDVSHEFKNPLAGIRSAAEVMAAKEKDQTSRSLLDAILAGCARLEVLISRVRDITVIDTRLPDEERLNVDLVQLIEMTLQRYRSRFQELVFDFEKPEAGEAAKVTAAPDRLVQVFENILQNAVSFSPPGGRIAVTLRKEKARLAVSIADEGPGLPPEHFEKIFDRFFSYRPDSGQSGSEFRAQSGREWHSGLGLSISKAIVEAHGGTVAAANRNEGRGAVFTITLPT